ncbi:hypothetical protein SD70_13995 [Gordoniibacillus kamchatkensis]|uniref:Glycosyl hydrolase family 32 N-terminal domain-containing protein n=1 Tax=Gordoniibacillus kamchatkensis TaxID=1590651 RepID=A0ABR5AH16_9BACL|nr:hypothetical protein [Paenibacillus sp. VKM B-2647]KIL40351.1 hypothetical protein SD70_13995 [Paenibacillus sp. VKM B-2647]
MGNSSSCVKFLFFDNRAYEYVHGFRREAGQAEKYEANPIVRPELAHEFKRVHYYGTAIYDEEEKLYKTWYSSHYYGPAFGESDSRAYAYLNYAFSEDGVHFVKPELDVVSRTNIVLDNDWKTHGPTVIKDVADPDPSKRYKLAMSPYTYKSKIAVYASPDGIHWRPLFDKPVLEVESDCHTGFYRDPDSGMYRLSFRTRCPDRRVWVAESADLEHWTKPILALEPDQSDPCHTQFYGMQMTPYGVYTVGLISMYDTYGYTVDPNFNKMAGTMDIQLAYSRDGFGWHRSMQGQKLVSLGAEGEWDSKCIMPSSTVIYRPDRMELFYSAVPIDHSGFRNIPYEQVPAENIGVAYLRPDGFVSLKANRDWCELMTRPFAVTDGRLYVNASATGGYVKAELCDTAGKAIEGFSFDDCVPFTADSSAAHISWNGLSDFSKVENRIIRVKLRALNAQVYSFFFPHGEDAREYWRFKEISCLDPLRFDIGPEAK